MPSKSQGDLVREQGAELVKLVERMDHFQKDLVRLETNLVEVSKVHQENQTRIAISQHEIEQTRNKVEEIRSRRWDVWKIVIAAVIGSLVTLFAKKLFDLFPEWMIRH